MTNIHSTGEFDSSQDKEAYREHVKTTIQLYKKRFQEMSEQFQQSTLPKEKEWGKQLEKVITKNEQNEHFWYLVWKHTTELNNTGLGKIFDLAGDTDTLMNFVKIIVTDVLAIIDLEREARHDSLTKLGNRRKFLEDIDTRGEEKKDGYLGMLYIDLDKLKDANNKYHHEGTDLILQEIAERMRGVAKEINEKSGGEVRVTPYRTGGDEMPILIETTHKLDDEMLKKLLAYILSAITRTEYVTKDDPWEQHLSCGFTSLQNSEIPKYKEHLISLGDGLQFLAKNTEGPSRNRPEGDDGKRISALATKYQSYRRPAGARWAMVLSNSPEELMGQDPKIEYVFDSASRGN